MPAFEERANAVTPRSISLASRTPTTLNSTLNDGATAWIALKWAGPMVNCHPRHARGDLFEQLQPLRGEAEFIRGKPGGIPAWARQAFDEAQGDRVADVSEHDGHGAAHLPQCLNTGGGR